MYKYDIDVHICMRIGAYFFAALWYIDTMQINYDPAPTVLRFHESDKFIRLLIGPLGSGKSVGCVVEILARALRMEPRDDGIRYSRWVCIRNSYRELVDTTLKTFNDWIPKEICTFRESTMTAIVRFNDVHIEVLFRALDGPEDIRKLLSLELTGAWLNEAREIDKAVFEAIQGRVGRFPSRKDVQNYWFGIIMDTNPSDVDHWIYKTFEENIPKDYEVFHQPSGLSPEAENLQNLPDKYYERIAVKKDRNWISVYCKGEYGFIKDGKPIYFDYEDSVHTAPIPIPPVKDHPLIIGIDFGLTPAAVICQDIAGQWRVLDELVAEDMGAVRFGEELGKLLRAAPYAGMELEIWGDPAGEQRVQTDETTPFQMLWATGLNVMPAPSNDFALRLEAVTGRLTSLNAGRPSFMLSPTCTVLRKAMAGGYKYRRVQVSGTERYADKPTKDKFSHVAEALQYAMLGAGEGAAVLGGVKQWYDDWDLPVNNVIHEKETYGYSRVTH